YGRLGALSLNQTNPSADGRLGGLIFEATCNCHFAQNYPYAIGPRLGMAYTLNSKTVIRGGIGLAYNSTGTAASGSASATATTGAPQAGFDSFKLRDGMPGSVNPQWPVFAPNANHVLGTVIAPPTIVDQNAGRPDRTIQWNIGVQREIARDLVVEAAYVANRN